MPAATYRGYSGRHAKNTDLKEALYMSYDTTMMPIAVHRMMDSENIILPEKELRRHSPNARILPNEFGDDIRFSVLNTEAKITPSGKNYNIFHSKASNYYLDFYPSGPHETFPIHKMNPKDGVFRPVHLGPPGTIASERD